MIISIDNNKTWGQLPAGLSCAGLFHRSRLLVSVSQETAVEALAIDGVRPADGGEVDVWCSWVNARAVSRPVRKGGPLAAHWRCTPERDDD